MVRGMSGMLIDVQLGVATYKQTLGRRNESVYLRLGAGFRDIVRYNFTGIDSRPYFIVATSIRLTLQFTKRFEQDFH